MRLYAPLTAAAAAGYYTLVCRWLHYNADERCRVSAAATVVVTAAAVAVVGGGGGGGGAGDRRTTTAEP